MYKTVDASRIEITQLMLPSNTNFGGKIPIAFKPAGGHFDVTALGGHRRQCKAERIRAILIDQFYWVQHIAL